MRWQDTEEIVKGLEENYPEEDLNTIVLSDLEDMVRSLSDFEDQDIANKKSLSLILEAWLEHRES